MELKINEDLFKMYFYSSFIGMMAGGIVGVVFGYSIFIGMVPGFIVWILIGAIISVQDEVRRGK